jgi:hypothetical protein
VTSEIYMLERMLRVGAAMVTRTVTSIILKWKKFGTTKTVPRAGCPAKLRNLGRRVFVRDVTKNLMLTDRAPEFLWGEGRTFQKDNDLYLCRTPPIRPLW